MNDLREEWQESERAFDLARTRLLALIRDAGLSEPAHYQWAYVDELGVLFIKAWDGLTLPTAEGIQLLLKAGFNRGIVFEDRFRKRKHLGPDGNYSDADTRKRSEVSGGT